MLFHLTCMSRDCSSQVLFCRDMQSDPDVFVRALSENNVTRITVTPAMLTPPMVNALGRARGAMHRGLQISIFHLAIENGGAQESQLLPSTMIIHFGRVDAVLESWVLWHIS